MCYNLIYSETNQSCSDFDIDINMGGESYEHIWWIMLVVV